MKNLANKIVFITGASSGIGKACAEQFAAAGAHLILTARRIDRVETLAKTLQEKHSIKTLAVKLDVQDKAMVKSVIDGLPSEWQNIDVLVNNAGLALGTDAIQHGNPSNWDTVIDTNIKGLLYVTRYILTGMTERNAGHIINIGSIAGHEYYPGGNIYSATKHAVKAIHHSLRLDLAGTPIRASHISPGAVETEFSEVRFNDKEKAKNFYQDFTPLVADDIADAVVYCASRPAHVNISEVTVMPTDQASCNHVTKKGQAAAGVFSK
jgi:3-hydroxy acid dehydrogenase / malonic semialdehyde reductase